MSPHKVNRRNEDGGEYMKKIYQYMDFKIEDLQVHAMSVNMASIYRPAN